MWEPRRLTTLLAFMACYRDSFTFFHKEIVLADLDRIDLAKDEDEWRALVITVVTFWVSI
jgi:hypothetical protein